MMTVFSHLSTRLKFGLYLICVSVLFWGAFLGDAQAAPPLDGDDYFIYPLTDAPWVQRAKWFGDGPAANAISGDYFGRAVSVSGNSALVGAPFDDDNTRAAGAAYIFERDQLGTWNQAQKLLADDGDADTVSESDTVSGGGYDLRKGHGA